jgi:hypothetical protein
MKIRPVGADLFHADGQVEADAFRNFANAPNNRSELSHIYIKLVPTSHKTLSISNEKAERLTLLRKAISICG